MLETSARRASLALMCGVAMAVIVAGCSEQERTVRPEPSATPLVNLNTSAMQIPRIAFCALLPHGAVRSALRGKPDSSTSYRNGDEVDLAGVGTEAVHEIGCSWSTDLGASARAWVFARPVDAPFARRAIASSREAQGCRVDDGATYGEPSVTQTCRPPDGSTRVRHAGLFGQTWLTCEVTAADPVASVRERAAAWCVEVANALNTAG